MKLNDIWGYGQLFGYSALDGANRYYNDFIGTLTSKKICIRFEMKEWIKVYFPVSGKIKFKAITGDMIEAENFFLTFYDADTLVGYSPVAPQIIFQKKSTKEDMWGAEVYSNGLDNIGVKTEERNGLIYFCIHHSFAKTEARSGANRYISVDVEELKAKRYAYFASLPKCKDKKYEKLYYKALSINKVNTHTAEGKIPCVWTTPDRVPHRHMWLWDSVFHALSFATYNVDIAKDAIYAVLTQQTDDGFVPHMMNPTDSSDVTQPQVLCWGVWEVYKKCGDKDFLKKCVPYLEKFLNWIIINRDKNGNGLLEWFTEPDYKNCRCGESGQDNSPRFDFDDDLDAVDFSMFQANDAKYLSKIYSELGESELAKKWSDYYEFMKDKINALLWNESAGVYSDRLFNGKFSGILTPNAFFPMFASIATKEQAEKMVQVLVNNELLWTNCPLATIAKNDPLYSSDMWRGGVWLNLNYFVAKGLRNYGYFDLAEKLRVSSIEMVNKWYKKTGCIYEFYDPEDKLPPYLCDRKGKCKNPPDWRKQVHSISDYNWSACFTLLFIQNEWYD